MCGKKTGLLLVCSAVLSTPLRADVRNPGFESGLDNWTVGGEVSVYSDAQGHFALFAETGGPAGPASSFISQVLVTASGDLPLSFEYMLVTSGNYVGAGALPDAFTARLLNPVTLQPLLNTPGVNDYFYHDTRGVDGSVDYDPSLVTLLDNAERAGWFTVKLDLTSLPAGTPALLEFDLMGTGTVDGQVTFVGLDNVIIPEPGTLTFVFGAGIWLLARRQRRGIGQPGHSRRPSPAASHITSC